MLASLLGFGDYSHCISTTINDRSSYSKLHSVYQSGYQTSGIMVVTRNQATVSTLYKAWRKRASMQQVYLAHVRHWPPYYHAYYQLKERTIDTPLAPSHRERISSGKFSLALAEGGKESKTYWQVYADFDNSIVNDEEGAAHKSLKLLGRNSRKVDNFGVASSIT